MLMSLQLALQLAFKLALQLAQLAIQLMAWIQLVLVQKEQKSIPDSGCKGQSDIASEAANAIGIGLLAMVTD
jgi:hypothetical protein